MLRILQSGATYITYSQQGSTLQKVSHDADNDIAFIFSV